MTDSTDTTPNALAGIYARYREIAPDPDADSKDPSKALAVSLLVHAQRDFTRMLSPAEPMDHELIRGMCARFAAVHLLAWLRANRPDIAGRLSWEVVGAWNDGGGIGEWLWEHAQPLGVDTDEVNRLAETEAEARGANLAAAGQPLADAMQAIDTLGAVIESHARVMFAALIDLGRGDVEAAKELLCLQLDGYDDDAEAPNGTETGMEYLNRLRAKEQAERALDAKPGPERM